MTLFLHKSVSLLVSQRIALMILVVVSDVSNDFLGILFLACDFRAGAQKNIIMNFEE